MHGGLLGVDFCLSVCLGLDQKSLEKNQALEK